jgi:hypothetical protein
MQPLMSEQTFIIISCTSTYGVLHCVKFNKKILWTVLKGYKVYGRAGAGAGIFARTYFFFGKNQGKKLKKKSPPPSSNNFCVVSRNGGGVNFS